MKFCADCETKLSQNHKDLGAPWICPKCNPEKIVVPEWCHTWWGFRMGFLTHVCQKLARCCSIIRPCTDIGCAAI